jgi:fructose-bisphosphate aldolase class I
MTAADDLGATIAAMTQPGKGLLAADESLRTIGKRFSALGIESTAQARRAYRSLLFTTPRAGEFISGAILFEETLEQKTDDGTLFVDVLQRAGIVPGIKVDKGTVPLANAPGEEITEGLDGLRQRLQRYREQGARFAKWRAVLHISAQLPSLLAIEANAHGLASYAALCQESGLVPIVEPEVLMDGDHSIDRCAAVTEQVLHAVFAALHRHKVVLEYMVLKPNMVLAGSEYPHQPSPDVVAHRTITVLRRAVPAAVPAIMFLSGGQSAELATAHLNEMNASHPGLPWRLSFSYGRALQDDAMKAWSGAPANVAAAQETFLKRARLNSLAARGQYSAHMEGDAEPKG